MQENFQFDEAFERRLVSFLIRDISFYAKTAGFIEDGYFTYKVHKDIFRLAKKYMEVYKTPLPEVVCRNEIVNLYTTTMKKDIPIDEYYEETTRLYKEDLNDGREYTEDKLLQFAKEKRMIDTLTKGMERVVSHKPLEPILTDVNKVLSIGNKLTRGYNYFEETVPRLGMSYDNEQETKVATGFRSLDRFLYGGLAQGELGVIGAPFNRGKTALLVNFAYAAVKRQKNVIFVYMEGGKEDKLGMRFDQLISEHTKDELRAYPDIKTNPACQHIELVGRVIKANIILQMFPTDTVTVDEIEKFIDHEELVCGFKADLIIVDYLNLCRRSNPRDENWMGASYREGKGMASRRQVPVWTAVQMKVDEKLRYKKLLGNHIAEATNRIASDVDVLLTVEQTQEEEEKKTEPATLILRLAKNRNNPGHKEIPINFYKTRQKFGEIPVDGSDGVA